MKISELTLDDLKDFCSVSDSDSDNLITMCQASAKAYIISHTGLDEIGIDNYEDLTLALCVIVNDMFINRTYQCDKSQVNPIAQQIISLNAVNLM